MIITRNKINVKEKDYLILTNVLIKQDSQNKNHNHRGNTGDGGVDHTHTTNVYHRHLIDNSGGHNHNATWGKNNDNTENGRVGNSSGTRYTGNITSSSGEHTHWTNTNIYDNNANYIGGNGTWNVTSSGASAYSHSHSINSDGGNESRPVNYTTKYWKRIS